MEKFKQQLRQPQAQFPHIRAIIFSRSPFCNTIACRDDNHERWEIGAEIIDLTLLNLLPSQRFTTYFCQHCKTKDSRAHYRLFHCQHVLCENCIKYVKEHYKCLTISQQCVSDYKKGF